MNNQYNTSEDGRFESVKFVTAITNKKGKLKGYCSECGCMMMEGEEECARCLSAKGVVSNAPEQRDFAPATWLSGKNG